MKFYTRFSLISSLLLLHGSSLSITPVPFIASLATNHPYTAVGLFCVALYTMGPTVKEKMGNISCFPLKFKASEGITVEKMFGELKTIIQIQQAQINSLLTQQKIDWHINSCCDITQKNPVPDADQVFEELKKWSHENSPSLLFDFETQKIITKDAPDQQCALIMKWANISINNLKPWKKNFLALAKIITKNANSTPAERPAVESNEKGASNNESCNNNNTDESAPREQVKPPLTNSTHLEQPAIITEQKEQSTPQNPLKSSAEKSIEENFVTKLVNLFKQKKPENKS